MPINELNLPHFSWHSHHLLGNITDNENEMRSTALLPTSSPSKSSSKNSSDHSSIEYHNELLTSPTIAKRYQEVPDDASVDDHDPSLEDVLFDAEVNYELAQYYSGGTESRDYLDYLGQKRHIHGKRFYVRNKNNPKKPIKWTVRRDIQKSDIDEFPKIPDSELGVRKFNFNLHTKSNDDGDLTRINTMNLLL